METIYHWVGLVTFWMCFVVSFISFIYWVIDNTLCKLYEEDAIFKNYFSYCRNKGKFIMWCNIERQKEINKKNQEKQINSQLNNK